MQAETAMYPEKATIFITLKGFAAAAETEKEVDIFEASMSTFPVDQTSLIIDCTNMATFSPDILPILERSYKLYNNFKHAVLVNPEKAVTKSQLQRVARNADFQGHFVDTTEQAWAIVGK